MSTRGRPPKNSQKTTAPSSDEPCSYSAYQCSLRRLEDYEYCICHILEDKSAPFRQCNFTYSCNSKRCFRAAHVSDKDGYCKEHSRRATRQHQKAALKPKPLEIPESCLEKLSSHHVMPVSSLYSVPDADSVPSIAASALEYGSEDENDSDFAKDLNVNLLPRIDDDSEFDSASSEYDLLDHAGVYTEEEVLQIYSSKMQKLKELYNDEFRRLFHVLKAAKREYYDSVKTEKESLGSIHSQPKNTLKEQESYKELKAMTGYHRHRGKEGLLHRQLQEKKRKEAEGVSYKQPSGVGCVKCIYSQGSWKCGEKSVPLTKYCFKHIMQDNNQVLFQECGSVPSGNEKCQVPVVPTPLSSTCIYHTTIPTFLPITNPTSEEELAQLPLGGIPPPIIDLSDSSAFVVSELPPENVMEGDALEQSDVIESEEQISVV